MTDIAVIGAGNIGGTLGRKWAAAGHSVTYGARYPEKPELAALAVATGSRTATIAEAIRGARMVLLAVPSASIAELLVRDGVADLLNRKAVIDATNNVRSPVMNSAEAILAASPGAQYFRAFNTLGWEVLAQPLVAGVSSDMFFCGPDGEERTVVEALMVDVGLRPIWVGGPDEVNTVDGVLRIWLTLVMKQHHSRHMAFKLHED